MKWPEKDIIYTISKPPKDLACISYLCLKNMLEPCQWDLSTLPQHATAMPKQKTGVQRNTPLKTSFSKRCPGNVLLVAMRLWQGIPGYLSLRWVKLIRAYLLQLDWVGSIEHVTIYTNDSSGLSLTSCSIYGCSAPHHTPFLFLSCSATRSSEDAFECGGAFCGVSSWTGRMMTCLVVESLVVIIKVAVLRLCEKRTCLLGNLSLQSGRCNSIQLVSFMSLGGNPNCSIQKGHVMSPNWAMKKTLVV